jgi:hypothetical protein
MCTGFQHPGFEAPPFGHLRQAQAADASAYHEEIQ